MKRLIVLSLGLVFITACCKEEEECQDPTNPNCINYDPCYGLEKPSAKFIMEESNSFLIGEFNLWVADSFFLGTQVRFRSELITNDVKHTWYVGNEVFTGAVTPSRNYLDVPRPASILISHVIEYTPNLKCFPEDDGRDSVSQTFDLVYNRNDFNTYGTFRGALNGTRDSFDIQIIRVDRDGNPADFYNDEQTIYINMHNKGDTLGNYIPQKISLFAFLYNNYGLFSSGLEGEFEVYADKTFKMHYKQSAPQSIPIIGNLDWHTFEGRKID